MNASDIPDVPATVFCEACGAIAIVVRRKTRLGEQLIIVKSEGEFYITIDCPQCGQRIQAIESTPDSNEPPRHT